MVSTTICPVFDDTIVIQHILVLSVRLSYSPPSIAPPENISLDNFPIVGVFYNAIPYMRPTLSINLHPPRLCTGTAIRRVRRLTSVGHPSFFSSRSRASHKNSNAIELSIVTLFCRPYPPSSCSYFPTTAYSCFPIEKESTRGGSRSRFTILEDGPSRRSSSTI
jgi:hypothetical protein